MVWEDFLTWSCYPVDDLIMEINKTPFQQQQRHIRIKHRADTPLHKLDGNICFLSHTHKQTNTPDPPICDSQMLHTRLTSSSIPRQYDPTQNLGPTVFKGRSARRKRHYWSNHSKMIQFLLLPVEITVDVVSAFEKEGRPAQKCIFLRRFLKNDARFSFLVIFRNRLKLVSAFRYSCTTQKARQLLPLY